MKPLDSQFTIHFFEKTINAQKALVLNLSVPHSKAFRLTKHRQLSKHRYLRISIRNRVLASEDGKTSDRYAVNKKHCKFTNEHIHSIHVVNVNYRFILYSAVDSCKTQLYRITINEGNTTRQYLTYQVKILFRHLTLR